MKEKRNGNVEAFRIALMAGIVSMHILGHGHLLELSSGPAEKVLWLIESLAYPSVNCFVIITGYFQSIVYLALYLVSPFLNAFIQNTNQKQMMKTTAALVVCGCAPVLSDKLGIYAMTLPWFVTLYFVGAMLRMDMPKRRPLAWGSLFVLGVVGLWLSRITSFPGQSFAVSNLFWRYNSFAVLGAAVAAFLLVLWCPVRTWPKWVYGVSGVTFGIYLIHDHADLRQIIWDRWVSALLPAQITLKDIWLMPALLLVIFIVCALMESGRKRFFLHCTQKSFSLN